MPLNERAIHFDVENQRIHGMLHFPTATQTPHPCVMLLHGFTGHRGESHRIFVMMARLLAAAGIAALRFDFRGSGESEGTFDEMTPSGEIKDTVAAHAFLQQQPEIDASRLGLLGLSMGGMVAALSVAQAPVKALCLWAPAHPKIRLWNFGEDATPESVRLAFKAGLPGIEFPPGTSFDASRGIMDIGGHPVDGIFFEDLARHEPFETVLAHKGPALVVHGDADPVVPHSYGEAYAKVLTARLHTVAGGLHTFETLPHQDEACNVTKKFFQENL